MMFLDLDDAVASDLKVPSREKVVRSVLAPGRLKTIIIPKVRPPEDIVVADTLLTQVEVEQSRWVEAWSILHPFDWPERQLRPTVEHGTTGLPVKMPAPLAITS